MRLLGSLGSLLGRLGSVLGGSCGVLEGPGERLGRLLRAFKNDLGSLLELTRHLESILEEIQQNLYKP